MEKETNGLEAVTKETCISLRTVIDWVKGEREIPKELIVQLSSIPQFKHLNKGVDEIEIELAYLDYRTEIDSIVVEHDFYGVPVTVDPYVDERLFLLQERDRKLELSKAEDFLYSSRGNNYLNALQSLNSIFSQKNASKIQRAIDFLSLLDKKESEEEVKNL